MEYGRTVPEGGFPPDEYQMRPDRVRSGLEPRRPVPDARRTGRTGSEDDRKCSPTATPKRMTEIDTKRALTRR